MIKKSALGIIFLSIFFACTPTKETSTADGTIERLDPALDKIISPDAKVEVIAKGYEWTEGPLWLDGLNMLIFSDVPKNTIYKWTEEKGAEVYLTPSGFTGDATTSKEAGSNGLLLSDEGELVLCQHGDRRLAIMQAPLDSPRAEFITLADKFEGKRFSSPNDAVFYNYNYYFTDPAYGLLKQDEDPEKEIPFQGVFCAFADGKVKVMVDSLTKPNGIAVSPDGKYLFVANSDSLKARWYQYEMNDTAIVSGKIFYDATTEMRTEQGKPDGMKIDTEGNIFASGPGGIWIFNSTGKVLGKIKLKEKASNTALSEDGKTLFVTNDMQVLRIKLR
jgi:gluconolactonase